MKHSIVHKIIAGSLLMYFALFIIPPVSSLTSASGRFATADDGTSLEQDHRQTRLYLVDIFIWLKLKESRHSGALEIARHDNIVSAEAIVPTDTLSALLPEQQERLVWTARSLRHAVSGHLSRSADIFFARSGIAPPSLV